MDCSFCEHYIKSVSNLKELYSQNIMETNVCLASTHIFMYTRIALFIVREKQNLERKFSKRLHEQTRESNIND